ncbi:MAG TPA: molybdopterin-binding protein [Candidatus Saccharimonadales bacterium]|nr:molybdopterin-binding protein [Candidatus Saccharimonadales bacterium]
MADHPAEAPSAPSAARQLRSAEVISVGSELTVGETRDSNAGDLAGDLSRFGVRVGRLTALPDRLDVVRDAFTDALRRSDVLVSTGGLGPTPDDLTRESIAAALGETPTVDPALEQWLRNLWTRRGIAFPTMNLKQAWLIPSATAIPNENGTAPGWWVDTREGRIVIALPGPPREMRPMWHDWVIPRLRARGLGVDHAIRTYRLTGIGESAVADLLGEELLRRENPVVATYARAEAVDVRISAHAETAADGSPGESADVLVESADATVMALLGSYVWGRDDETWAQAIGRRLSAAGWSLSTVEVGTGGTLVGLLGDAPWLGFAEVVAPAALLEILGVSEIAAADPADRARHLAEAVRSAGHSVIGLAVEARESGRDTTVEIAIASPTGTAVDRRTVFMGGQQGRLRAALMAAALLWSSLPPEGGKPV